MILIHTKYVINVNIGKTITWKGIDFDIYLNITTKIPNGNNIQPPFEQTNFIHDILIMTKEGYGPRISQYTGIKDIDNMDIVNKNLLFAKIIEDLCYYKTYILANNYLYNNYLAMKSIELINNGWFIINSPISISKNKDTNEEICIICLDNIEKNSDIGMFKTNNCTLHKNCLIDYIKNKVNNDTDKLLCPYRQPIDFVPNNSIFDYLKNRVLCI